MKEIKEKPMYCYALGGSESFTGEFDTQEEALSEAMECADKDEAIQIGEAIKDKPSRFIDFNNLLKKVR